MSHSMWLLASVAKLPRNLVHLVSLSLAVLFAVHAPSLAVVGWPFHSDRDLITKLYNEDFAHISDDNVGRLDLETVIWAFQNDPKRREKCSLLGDQTMDAMAKYIRYPNTDR